MYDYFDLWSWDGTLDLIHHELYVKCREAVGRDASPTDDAGKKIKGKKRHILVDTQGLLMHAIVHAGGPGIALRGAKVTLLHFLDGTMRVTYKGRSLPVTHFQTRPTPDRAEDERPSTCVSMPSSPRAPRRATPNPSAKASSANK